MRKFNMHTKHTWHINFSSSKHCLHHSPCSPLLHALSPSDTHAPLTLAWPSQTCLLASANLRRRAEWETVILGERVSLHRCFFPQRLEAWWPRCSGEVYELKASLKMWCERLRHILFTFYRWKNVSSGVCWLETLEEGGNRDVELTHVREILNSVRNKTEDNWLWITGTRTIKTNED